MNKNNSTQFKNILFLFEILKNVNQKDIQYLKQLYNQSSRNFEDCIEFV